PYPRRRGRSKKLSLAAADNSVSQCAAGGLWWLEVDMQRGLGQALVMVIPALTLCANVASAQYSCTSAWGSLGPADGQFEGPQGIAVAPNGHVYVAEGANNCRVQEFTAAGTFVRKWGKMGSGP